MTAEQEDLPDYPHTYKVQREYERVARNNRAKSQAQKIKSPPICGFSYMKRKPKRIPEGWKEGMEICERTAGAGTDHHGHGYCDYHEVQAKRETAPGKRRMTRDVQEAKKAAFKNASFFGERIPTDPHMALMEEIARTAGIIKWIESHMEEMRDGSGMTEDAILTQFSKQNGWVPGVWMELYTREREHLVRTCTGAIKAGVAERRVQIAEQQGQIIVAMMMAFLHDPDLGLSAQQIQAGPSIIRKHMLALPRADSPTETLAMNAIESVAKQT